MDSNDGMLVENDLIRAITGFNDYDKKTEREELIYNYFHDFCKSHNIDEMEAYEIVEKYINYKKENQGIQYKNLSNLKELLFTNNDKDDTLDKENDER